jgi:glycosyltransferase involved in cell wall biosynthesis
MNPTLSVILPNYNHAHYIAASLDAVLKQSVQPMEIIVVDDASTDNSVDIIDRYVKNNPHIRLHQNPKNIGHLQSINNTLKTIRGDYYHVPAADDVVLPGLYEKSLALLAANPQAGLCSSLMRSIDEIGNDIGLFSVPIVSPVPVYIAPADVEKKLKSGKPWFTGVTTIYRRACAEELGFYPMDLRNYADAVLSQVLALKYGTCFIPEALGTWRRVKKGYANTMHSDVGVQIDILKNAARRFRSVPYSQMIPPAFARRWIREWTFDAAARLHQEHRDRLGELKELTDSFFEKALFSFAGVVGSLGWVWIRLYQLFFLQHESMFSFLVRQIKSPVEGQHE